MSLINDALKRAKQTHRQQTVTPDIVAVAAMPPLQPVEDTPARGALSGGSKRLLLLVPLLFVMGGLGAWFLWQWSTSGKANISPTLSTASLSVIPVEGGKKNPLQIAAATVAQVVARAQTEPTTAPESVASRTDLQAPKSPAPTAPAETVTAPQSGSVAAPAPAPTVAATPVTVSSPALTDGVPSTSVAPGPIPANPVASPETAPLFVQTSVRTPAPVRPEVLAPPTFKLQGIFFRVKNPTALINDRIVSVGEIIDGYRIVQIERQSVKLSVPNYTNIVTLH